METHIKNIKDHLLSGKSITKLEALKMFGCWNTGDVIHKLRKHPYNLNIKTEMVEAEKKGRRFTFAKYSLIIENN